MEPNRTVTFAELLREGDTFLTIALVTFAISPDEAGCRLELTDQVTSLVGAEGTSGHRAGYENALSNLDRLLAPASAN